jgi:hypothetical protein
LKKVDCNYSANENCQLNLRSFHDPNNFYNHWIVGSFYDSKGIQRAVVAVQDGTINEKGKTGLKVINNKAWVDRITVESVF